MTDEDFSRKSFPWLRAGFDLEGYVGALAAWLVGILLGIVWGPLFWIGFFAAIVILFATRTAERTPPEAEDLITAPTDGLVVSVGGATPPDELRLEGAGWTRVRISVGPTKTNGIHAPMDGAIDHVILETGDPAAFAAMKPDRPGLAVAYVSLESGARSVGLRLATGGLGPRLEIANEAGDAVRLGRNIGTLRLGGWCDLYVPSDVEVLPRPGQTLVCSETVIGRFGSASADLFENDMQTAAPVEADDAPADEDEPIEAELVIDEEDELTLEELAGEDATSDEDEEEDVSEMFARLRKEAKKIQDED
nr:phosphatidylserine decarboxylase [Hyphomonas sp. Mor2]